MCTGFFLNKFTDEVVKEVNKIPVGNRAAIRDPNGK